MRVSNPPPLSSFRLYEAWPFHDDGRSTQSTTCIWCQNGFPSSSKVFVNFVFLLSSSTTTVIFCVFSLSDDSLKASHPNSPSQLVQNQQQPAQDPIVMPGFPVRTLQAHPPPPYSPSRYVYNELKNFAAIFQFSTIVPLSFSRVATVLSKMKCSDCSHGGPRRHVPIFSYHLFPFSNKF